MAGIKTFGKPSDAIKWAKDELFHHGYTVKTEKWQGIDSPDDMWETMNLSMQFFMPHTIEELVTEIRPNLPWADEHFGERVGGQPLNPPPSHVRWPFAQKNNAQFGGHDKFSHTYPERLWPKFASEVPNSKMLGSIRKESYSFRQLECYPTFKTLINTDLAVLVNRELRTLILGRRSLFDASRVEGFIDDISIFIDSLPQGK